ncbi:MAG: hypothetical protein HS104_11475 [Polyangiaceae bacterium]|nr:hypothetical protein [Polyangiaceae bacterium]
MGTPSVNSAHFRKHVEGLSEIKTHGCPIEARVTNQPFQKIALLRRRTSFEQRSRTLGEFQNALGRFEVAGVDLAVRVTELLEPILLVRAKACELPVVGVAVDLAAVEPIEEPVFPLFERPDLGTVDLR